MSNAEKILKNILSRIESEQNNSLDSRVLVVEDSPSIRYQLANQLSHMSGIRPTVVSSYSETELLLKNPGNNFLCAILDLNLPDAPNGEIVDLVKGYGLPVIVLTGNISKKLREKMLKMRVVDYLVKQSSGTIEEATKLAQRLLQNKQTKVLVVDDSPSYRMHLKRLFEQYQFITLSAENGQKALKVLHDNPDLKLIITDYQMPVMDGQQLTLEVRKKFHRDDLAIIAISDDSVSAISYTMLKSGCNDFLRKPFHVEEFLVRINQNIDNVNNIRRLKDLATRDQLTQLHNRYFLYSVGNTLYSNAKRGNICISLAMVDIDHFKKVNDTYGHAFGDLALKAVADAISESLRESDIIVRFGGEEFVCITSVKDSEDTKYVYEKLREAVTRIDLELEGEKIPLSISVGATTNLCDNLDKMIKAADNALYQAKEQGRNRVIFS